MRRRGFACEPPRLSLNRMLSTLRLKRSKGACRSWSAVRRKPNLVKWLGKAVIGQSPGLSTAPSRVRRGPTWIRSVDANGKKGTGKRGWVGRFAQHPNIRAGDRGAIESRPHVGLLDA